MKLVFATNNQNKIKEVENLIPSFIQLLSLDDIGCEEEIPETRNTIEGNAEQKALYVKSKYGFDCFADDTGLQVDALNGQPGVYSARYAGEQKNAEDNMNKLLYHLKDNDNRKAQFKTVIALHLNGEIKTFTGVCRGEITHEKHGSDGFGYDPIFNPLGYTKTFAEISLEEKNAIGHRGKAVSSLVSYLNSLNLK